MKNEHKGKSTIHLKSFIESSTCPNIFALIKNNKLLTRELHGFKPNKLPLLFNVCNILLLKANCLHVCFSNGSRLNTRKHVMMIFFQQ